MSIEYWLNKENPLVLSDAFTFVTDSNAIEGITRMPTKGEVAEHERFVSLKVITITELERFVSVYQPDAKLRHRYGMDVRVGNHIPPKGGKPLVGYLLDILAHIRRETRTLYQIHHEYETLHPFTDCNGRSGRALWAWHMKKKGLDTSLGFLHTFYYQALEGARQ